MLWLRFLILGIAGLVFGILDDWQAITIISLALLVLIGVLFIWSRFALRGVTFARSCPSQAMVGDSINQVITLWNRSLLAKLYIEIDDQTALQDLNARGVVSIGSRTVVRREVISTIKQRGKHTFGPVVLRSSDPLGFFRRERRVAEPGALTVLPYTVSLPGYLPPSPVQADGGTINRRSHIPTVTVAGVRDFLTGDPINIISWSATARTGRLMSREFDLDPTSDAWVILDVAEDPMPGRGRPDSDDPIDWLENNLEYRIMLASSLTKRLLDIGRAAGLLLNTPHTTRLAPERSHRQFGHVSDILAAIGHVEAVPLAELVASTSFQFRQHTALLIITSRPEPDLAVLLATMKRRRISSEIFFVSDQETPESASYRDSLSRFGISFTELTRFDHPSTLIGGHQATVRTGS